MYVKHPENKNRHVPGRRKAGCRTRHCVLVSMEVLALAADAAQFVSD